ncbi:hypothetical protein BGY98DRAFT_992355 [Russula aff. rugulosa BPL654]|nr:hypothetical protein BGY98DRAFT_992355 [Russula aff. rugulosa BPL654]
MRLHFSKLRVCTCVPGTITNDQLSIRCHPENIYHVGSVDALKDWLPDNALSMNPVNYSIWSEIQYNYMCKFLGRVMWESDPNRVLTTLGSGKYRAVMCGRILYFGSFCTIKVTNIHDVRQWILVSVVCSLCLGEENTVTKVLAPEKKRRHPKSRSQRRPLVTFVALLRTALDCL